MDEEEFDAEIAAFFRYAGIDEDELQREIAIAKALLECEGFVVI